MNGLPTRFEVGSGPVVFNALLIDIDDRHGRCEQRGAPRPHRRGVTP